GVEPEKGIAREIHLCNEPRQKRRSEQGKVNMSGTPCVGMIAPRIGAGLDAHETIAPFLIGHSAAGACKIRIKGGRVLVLFMDIPAGGVRLPYLDEGIRDRAAILIGHAACDDDALAQGLPRMLLGEVATVLPKSAMAKERSCQLGQRLR